MFRGRFNHQIDAKGRMSVPSRFRETLSSNDDEKLIITNFDDCLWAYPAAECPIDKQGRILVPPSLREYAGLARDVVVVGMTRRFELWSRERWDDVFRNAQLKLTDMGSKLADLGL